MDFTLSGIRTRVIIDKLDDEDYDSDIVDRFINDTIRYIYNRYELPFQEKIFSGIIPQGATIFEDPTDVALVQSRLITSPDGTQYDMTRTYTDFRTFNSLYPTPANNAASKVGVWTQYGGNVLLSAPTDKEYTMNIFYIKKPTFLSADGDVPGLPYEFEEAIVLGALYRCQKRNEDEVLAADTKRDFKDELDTLASRYGFRQSNGPIKMKNRQR